MFYVCLFVLHLLMEIIRVFVYVDMDGHAMVFNIDKEKPEIIKTLMEMQSESGVLTENDIDLPLKEDMSFEELEEICIEVCQSRGTPAVLDVVI